MKMEFRPIDTWPWSYTSRREDSQFSADYTSTKELLYRELRMINTRVGRICMALGDDGIRKDRTGPLANATPDHPGVMVVAETTDGSYRWGTDQYRDWQHNLRAVALGLEALRKVDRYGITRSGEQYRGFQALPSGEGEVSSKEQAARILLDAADSALPVETLLRDPKLRGSRVFKEAAKHEHPDRGGTPERWHRLEAAAKLLGVR